MVNEAIDRGRYTGLRAEADDGTVLRFQFGSTPLQHVALHRRCSIFWERIDEAHGGGDYIAWQAYPMCPGYRMDFLHGALQQTARARLSAYNAYGHARDCPEAADGGDEQEFLPHRGFDVQRHRNAQAPAAFEGLAQPLGAFARRVVELVEADERIDPDMPNVAGLATIGDDSAESAQHACVAELSGELVGRLDSILHGYDKSRRTQYRVHCSGGLHNLPGFDADQDGIHSADFARVVGRLNLFDAEVALNALHPQSVAPYCLQVGTPGNKYDVLTGLGKATPKIPSDSARTEDRYAHVHLPSLKLTLLSGGIMLWESQARAMVRVRA